MLRILHIGDIVGRPGRRAVKKILPVWKERYGVNLTIANAENAAGGNGLTRAVMNELLAAGIDILTSGNHIWDKKEVLDFIDAESRLLRPANYPPATPGSGYGVVYVGDVAVGIINMAGRAFMSPLDCPFRTADSVLEFLQERTRVVVVDFHAEATAEKEALGWYLDGRVSAVCGTHTHVQTSDARVLPRGTGYITDLGMAGARHSVLGMKVEPVLQRLITQLPARWEVASGETVVGAALITVDEGTGKAIEIQALQEVNNQPGED